MLLFRITAAGKAPALKMLVNPETAYSRIEYKGVSIEKLQKRI